MRVKNSGFRVQDSGFRVQGLRYLPPLRIVHGDHRHCGDSRVGRDGQLDFERGNVLPSGDDDVFRAVLQLDVPEAWGAIRKARKTSEAMDG